MKPKAKVKKKVRITNIVYRRIKNLGNYENEQIEAVAFIQADECPNAAIKQLRDWVNDQLEIDDE